MAKIDSKAFTNLFLIMTILIWFPSKYVTYVSSFLILVFYFVLHGKVRPIIRLIFFLAIYSLILIFYNFIYSSFSTTSAIFILFTYSPFIVVGVLFYNYKIEYNELSLLRISSWIILIQGIVGLSQIFIRGVVMGEGLDGDVGDFVCGTLKPLSFVERIPDFTNQIFSINLLIYITLYIVFSLRKKTLITIKSGIILGFGLIVVLLASTLHIFIFWLLSFSFTVMIFSKNHKILRKFARYFVVAIVALILVFRYTQPKNVELFGQYFSTYTSSDSIIPKVKLVHRLFKDLPEKYPYVAAIGLGPGQFSSRAAMIASGTYFGGIKNFDNSKINSIIPVSEVYPYNLFIHDLRIYEASIPWMTGTLTKPYFSWATICGEFGYLFFLFCIFLMIKFIISTVRKTRNSTNIGVAILKLTVLLFISFLGFAENYFETPQVTLLALFILFLPTYIAK